MLLCASCSLQPLIVSDSSSSSSKSSKLGFWRFSRLEVAVENDPGKDCYDISSGLLQVLARRIGCKPAHLSQDALAVVRKSFDARKVPKFVYTVDLNVAKLVSDQPRSWSFVSRMKQDPGVVEFLRHGTSTLDLVETAQLDANRLRCAQQLRRRSGGNVMIVGSGPAGLFAALAMAKLGLQVTLVERGYPVETRGRHIGSLMVRRILNEDSNFCYGEGGAGTWSDGKLTTRIGKNSEDVRTVLKTLVRFGAANGILVEGKPHIGTDKLIHILRDLRGHLEALGVRLMFGTRMDDIVVRNGRVNGIVVTDLEKSTKSTLDCDALVLAVGHSARDTYEVLQSHGVLLSAKDFAVGLRVEHPQELVNQIRYRAWASQVERGKGKVPVADYKVAASVNVDENLRSCYSFCMCPGGQIVPTSTDPLHLCINGMSFSKRASKWANAALVVNVTSEDLDAWRNEHGSLAGVAFQKAIERRAAGFGGGHFVVPAQTLQDFLDDKVTGNLLPASSYRLGVREAPLHELLPGKLTAALKTATEKFNQQLHGFIDSRALLHGVETRTSSPVTIERDADTFESVSVRGFYPVGEGAGYAGGIVSAAVDGMKVGLALGKSLLEITTD